MILRRFFRWLRKLFGMSGENKPPYFHVQNNLYFAKELDGFSITKLSPVDKTNVMNEKVSQEQLASIFAFLSKSGDNPTKFKEAMDFLNS